MAKIQLELSEEENRIVEVYKIVNRLNSKQEAIKQMIHYFEAEVKPKKLANKDYFQV
ncbi:MAG: hypothetical protein WC231_04720 [Dehalococcoidales bacterium]|jgi:hypothetical protein|nr:DUF2683 family protein [Dehalococcoidales bacterium]